MSQYYDSDLWENLQRKAKSHTSSDRKEAILGAQQQFEQYLEREKIPKELTMKLALFELINRGVISDARQYMHLDNAIFLRNKIAHTPIGLEIPKAKAVQAVTSFQNFFEQISLLPSSIDEINSQIDKESSANFVPVNSRFVLLWLPGTDIHVVIREPTSALQIGVYAEQLLELCSPLLVEVWKTLRKPLFYICFNEQVPHIYQVETEQNVFIHSHLPIKVYIEDRFEFNGMHEPVELDMGETTERFRQIRRNERIPLPKANQKARFVVTIEVSAFCVWIEWF